MGIKEFAKSISGKEYDCPQFTKEEIKTAKSNGIYIMYAENDSTIKIEGAIKKSFQVKKYCETEDFKNEECEQESGKYLLHFTRHGVVNYS